MASSDRRKKASGEDTNGEARNLKASLTTNILDLLEERMTDEDDGSTLKEFLRKLKRSRLRREKRLKTMEKKKERESIMKLAKQGSELTENQNGTSTMLPKLTNPKETVPSLNSMKSNLKLIYGYGPSEFQSSSSLQRSIPSISFSKSERFKNQSISRLLSQPFPHESSVLYTPTSSSVTSSLTPRVMSTTIRGASMGLGLRIGCISEKRLQEEALKPGPGQYELQSETTRRQRVTSLPFFDQRCIDSSLLNNKDPTPGPGRYEISMPLLKTNTSFILKSVLTDRSRKAGKSSINDNSDGEIFYRKMLKKESREGKSIKGKIRFDDVRKGEESST